MSERAEEFMDRWLDANVAKRHPAKLKGIAMKVLAKRCAADATLQGVPVEELEGVVVDIEEAIVDELNVIAARECNQ